jgi:hypothetical protein
LRFKLDTFAYRGTNLDAPQHPFSILGGGQYSWHIRRESIFVEGLMGDCNLNKNWGTGQKVGQVASFSSLVGGGLDIPLTRRFGFRVSSGFQYTNFNLGGPHIAIPYRLPGMPNYFARISSGLVWQF